MATTAVEMALKVRLQKRPDNPSGLKKPLRQAIREGLLRDEGFPSREHAQAKRTGMFGGSEQLSETVSKEPGPRYAERVAEFMRHFRNVFANPSGHWILFPGQALNFLALAGEVISQLWPENESGA